MINKKNFVKYSIRDIVLFFKESVFSDEYASQKGFLQSFDPRIKTITFLLFLILVLLTKSIIVLLSLYAISIILVYFSKIKLGFFLKRTWIFIPLFSLFIAIPAMFSVFTPGEPLVILKMAGLKFIITRQGLFGAEIFVMRVITSVSFMILLTITTKHFELLKVLRVFKIPQIFVMTISMGYRYIFLFIEIIENMNIAIKSRIGGIMHYKKGQKIVAYNIAFLWQYSYQLNEDVYKAMLSRGYNGEPVILGQFKTNLKDWLWLIAVLMIFILIIYINYCKPLR